MIKRILPVLLAIILLPVVSFADTAPNDYSPWLWFARGGQAPETVGKGAVLWYEEKCEQSFRQDLLPESALPADEADVKYVIIAREGESLLYGYYQNGAEALIHTVDIIAFHAGTGAELARKTVQGGNPPEKTTSSERSVFGSWPSDRQIAEAVSALYEEISELDENTPSVWKYVIRTEEDIPGILAEYEFTEQETLEKLVIEPGVEILGYRGYADGVLQIPETIEGLPVTAVGKGAFDNVQGFSAIVLPDSVTRLGEFAFANIGICRLELSDRITVIPASALIYYLSETIHFPSGLKAIANFGCSGMMEIRGELELPEGLEFIGRYAFEDCTHIQDMTIPRSVKSIAPESFEDCRYLTLHVYRDSYAYSFFTENEAADTLPPFTVID